MKARSSLLFVLLAAPGFAQGGASTPEPGVPLTQEVPAAPTPAPAAKAAEPQRLWGPASGSLIAPEAAKAVLDQFREAYPGKRIVIYVNRALVDTEAGLRLTGKTENYETAKSSVKNDMETPAAGAAPQTQVNVSVNGPAGGNAAAAGRGTASNESEKTSGQNTYTLKDGTKATLADQQTVREVERLFGRVFRSGGAKLADQKTASSLLGDEPGRLAGNSDQAAKDRTALASIADIAIEVLISSRNLTLSGFSGDQSYSVPDIQATAIQLSDSAVLGQASASDVLGKDAQAGPVVRNFDVRDITEATALALAEDMLTR